MIEFPKQLRAYLLRIDENTWRAIRAQVRWAYRKRRFTPPRRLARFMYFLPETPETWKAYADEITQARQAINKLRMTVRKKKKIVRAKKLRRDYQRNYMREYRYRLRHGTL
jgi:hypothetical protein